MERLVETEDVTLMGVFEAQLRKLLKQTMG